MVTLRIWDLPTRLFHGLLAVCVIGLVVSGNVGGDAMVWHFRLGYAVFTLLLFRLVWGFVGGHWSRWAQLPWQPSRLLTYLRGQATPDALAGHNPLGSWSVLALLFFLALQVGTGLFSDDEIANAGPLSALVSGSWVSLATGWHKHFGKLILILLVITHLLAIAWYRWRKHQALVPAMWHGDKTLEQAVPPSRDDLTSRLLALLIALVAAAIVCWTVGLAS